MKLFFCFLIFSCQYFIMAIYTIPQPPKEGVPKMCTSLYDAWFIGDLDIFSSPEPKAHLWAFSIGRHPLSIHPSTFSNISSEATGSVEAKFYMEPPWVGGMKIPSNGHGRRWPPCPYLVKTFKNLLLQNQPMILKLDMQHKVLEYYQIPSNDDPRLTFDLFRERSTLLTYAFIREKASTEEIIKD